MADRRDPGDLLGGQGEQGTCVERGTFRLDWQRARRKIQDFKLAEPHAYVLELVQAAVAADATRIQIRMDADDMRLEFDGQPYSRAELDGLFDALFTEEPSRARLKQLALGAVTSLGLGPKFVTIASGDGRRAAELSMTSLDDVRLRALPEDEIFSGTRVHLREKLSWKVMAEAMWRPNPEEGLLRERCRFCPVPITLNGDDLRWPLVETSGVAQLAFEENSTRGEVVLPVRPGPRSELYICLRGVQIVRELLPGLDWLGQAGLRIRIDDPNLKRNASHTDVLRDEAFDLCLARARAAALSLLDGWVRAELLDDHAAEVNVGLAVLDQEEPSFEQRLALLRLAARALIWPEAPTKGGPAEAALLEVPDLVELPFEDEPAGPLRPLVMAFADSGVCHTGTRRFRIDREDRTYLAPVALGPKQLLEDLFGSDRLLDADDSLASLERRSFNRKARQASRRPPALPPGRYLVRRPLERKADPALRGEVGLSADPGDAAWLQLDLLIDGAPLETLRREASAFAGRAVIDCPSLHPNDEWDGVIQDAVFQACIQAVDETGPGMLEALSESYKVLPPAAGLVKLGWWHPKSEPAPPLASPAAAFGQARLFAVRRQVDWLLGQVGVIDREAATWLWSWPLFWTLTGKACSLDEIVAAPGAVGWVAEERFMPAPPFGPDALVLNLTGDQPDLLASALGERLVDRSEDLTKARARLTRKANRARKREHNLLKARLAAQRPDLPVDRYLARVDLPADLGDGQAGVPTAGQRSFVRVLIDDLPLYELDVDASRLPFCVQAVVEPDGMEADATFSKLRHKRDRRRLRQAVVDAVPQLVAALSDALGDPRSTGRAQQTEERIWEALAWEDLSPGDVPAETRALALVPTVGHGRLSLNALDERVDANQRLDWVAQPEGPVGDELLLACSREQAEAVGRVLGRQIRNRTRSYRRKLAAAKRRRGPRQAPALTDHVGRKVSLDHPDFRGELGFSPELLEAKPGSFPKARIMLMADGRKVNRVTTDLDHLPAVGVVDSTRFTVSDDWTRVKLDAVWKEAREVLKEAAAELVDEVLLELTLAGPRFTVALPVCQALQAFCGWVFRKTPPADAESLAPDERILADAQIWPMPGGRRVSLVDIAAHHARTKRIWVVTERQGFVSEQRIMLVDLNGLTRTALRAVFTTGIQDGTKVLRRESERQRRKMRRPLVMTVPAPGATLAWAPIVLPDGPGLSASGYCGLAPGTKAGVALEIGVDGHRLCQRHLSHVLQGVAVVDCEGLRVDAGFRLPTDQAQIDALETAVREASYAALEELIAAWQAGRVDPASRAPARECLLNAMVVTGGAVGEQAQRFERLTGLDLFEDLAGQPVSGRDVLAAAAQAPLRVVDPDSPAGLPADGGLVVRADPLGLDALQVLVAGRIERWDAAWRAELNWRNRDQPELVLAGLRERLGQALGRVGTRSDLADAALLGFGPPVGRDLITYLDGWNVNAGHPAFIAAQRLLGRERHTGGDPLLHLAAAIGPVMLSEAPPEVSLKLLVRLADQALDDAGAQPPG